MADVMQLEKPQAFDRWTLISPCLARGYVFSGHRSRMYYKQWTFSQIFYLFTYSGIV